MGSELGLTEGTTDLGVRSDRVSTFFAVFTGLWTLFIAAGAFFLYRRRDSPVLRIRGIGLSLSAVGFLHLYWISVQLGYAYRFAMPGDAEYWIMSTWLPLGIALFHASNTRFLHVARAQRRFVTYEKISDGQQQQPGAKSKGLLTQFRRMDHTRKVFVLVAAGMLFQVGFAGVAHSSGVLWKGLC